MRIVVNLRQYVVEEGCSYRQAAGRRGVSPTKASVPWIPLKDRRCHPAEIGLVEPILAIPGVPEGRCFDTPLPQIAMEPFQGSWGHTGGAPCHVLGVGPPAPWDSY